MEFLKSRTATASFAIIALIGGFYFLNSNMTGNIVLKNQTAFSTLPLVGLLLIACSVILALYSIKKRL